MDRGPLCRVPGAFLQQVVMRWVLGRGTDDWVLAMMGSVGGGVDQSFALLCMTPILGLGKSEETLDVVQSGFGLPTRLAHTVFKCLN